MKFTNVKAFQKHIETASIEHLCNVYLILDPESYIQQKVAKKLLDLHKNPEIYTGAELTLQKLSEILETHSMFSENKVVCIYEISKLTKPLLKKLLQATEKKRDPLRLILTAASMPKELSAFNKSGIILDLTQEKPWDRDKRLMFEIVQKFSENQLKISSALASQMVKMSDSKAAIIDQEIEKLICYLNGKNEVCREDLKLLGSYSQSSLFKIGQALLENNLKEALFLIHSHKFPMMLLIYSLRTIFQRNFRIKGLAVKDIGQYYPQLRGTFLDKNIQWSAQHTSEQFKKMLAILFEIELIAKNQTCNEEFLQSLLLLKIGLMNESLPV